MKKLFMIIVLVVAILGVNFALPIVVRGYGMYNDAIHNRPLDIYIDEIRARDNYISLEDVSSKFTQELVNSEDIRFYEHFGFDVISFTRALVTNLQQGRKAEGGSTITQQLAKNMYFTFDKKYERKVAEVLVAFDLERNYSKEEILELYVNVIYFGEDCFGIKTASLHYFDKLPNELNEQEIDSLVYTIKSPNNYNPHKLELSLTN